MDLKDIFSDSLLEWCDTNGEKYQQDDTDVDSFLLAALDSFERDHATSSAQSHELPRPLASSTHTCNAGVRPYAAPMTDQEIADARVSGIPKKTHEDTQYLRLYCTYCKHLFPSNLIPSRPGLYM